MPLAINAEACGNGGRRPGSRNKLAEEAFNIALKLVNEGGEQAMREVMLKEPAKFCQLMVALIPQHFKHEVEHTIAGLSPDEVRARLAESRAKLLDAGIDLEALPVVEALPAPTHFLHSREGRSRLHGAHRDRNAGWRLRGGCPA